MTDTPPEVEPLAAPLGVAFSSSILRLPSHLRSPALRKISANANAPGGGTQKSCPTFTPVVGRAQKAALNRLTGTLGIFAVETRPSALAAQIGGVNSEGIAVTLDTGSGGTPAGTQIASDELDAVTYGAGGVKTLVVTVPGTLRGEAQIVV